MNEISRADEILVKLIPPITLDFNAVYRPSQFTFSFNHAGKQYAFNMLTKQCLETEIPLSAKAGEGRDELIKGLFLVPEGKDECAFYNAISSLMRAFNRRKGFSCYTILPTLGCNARRVYCFEEGMKSVRMTPETVEQTIRFILKTRLNNKVCLSWFGGEPLLCPDIIDRVCEGMREAGLEYLSAMTSNGSLITPQIVEKMVDRWNLINIQISMDGAEEDYLARKNYPCYRNYYHTVIDSIGRLSEAGIKVSVRCNVDENNWNSIPRLLDDLSQGVKHKKNVGVYFSPLYHARQSEKDIELWESILTARQEIIAAGFKVAPFAGLGLRFRISHCMADRGDLAITPDGSLHLCEHCQPESRCGDVWNGITDESVKTEFGRFDRTRDQCKTCAFLPSCTSFSSCPVIDLHCREVHELQTLDALRAIIDKHNANESEEEEETPVC